MALILGLFTTPALLSAVHAQPAPYVFTTLAGKAGASGTTDEPGVAARFNGPYGVAIDAAKNLYVADTGNHTIRKIANDGTVSTLAGSPGVSGSADGQGEAALFNRPTGVAVDLSGNVYVADWGNHVIRKITPGGMVSTLAGLAGSSGTNDDTGSLARFNHPAGVVVDALGNLYVADEWNHAIRKLQFSGGNWVVTTIAGQAGLSGDADGAGSQARFHLPAGLAVDGDGNLYVADSGNDTIRKVAWNSSVWTVTTVAGLPENSGTSDGLKNAARFNQPTGVAVDALQNLYVADFGNHTLRFITPAGAVSTLAGTPGSNGSANGLASPTAPSWATTPRFNWPAGVAVDTNGDVYVAERGNHTIREGAPAIAPVILTQPRSVTTIPGVDALFTVTVAGKEPLTYQWKINGQDALGATSPGVDVPADETEIGSYVLSVEVTSPYGSVTSSNVMLTITAPNAFVTLAGAAPNAGYADGLGPLAQFNRPGDVALDRQGNVYVADAFNDVIRKVTPAGVTTTLAGRPGVYGFADGVGTNALFQTPYGVTTDTNGNLFVADTYNHVIRKLVTDGTNWTVSLFAGSPGTAGTNDGAALGGATFDEPVNITADAANNLLVADLGSGRIRKITPDGTVTTVIQGYSAFLHDGQPTGVAVNSQGNLFAADSALSIIWSNTVTYAGGTSIYGGTADGPASTARFNHPQDVGLNASNEVFVADTGNNTIRKINTAGLVSTIAGNPPPTNSYGESVGGAYDGASVPGGFADGVGTNALFNNPYGLAVDSKGLVYVADTFNHAIRKEWPSFFISAQPDSQAVQVNSDATFSVVAAADTGLTYQWLKDNVAIDGATDEAYTIHGVQTGSAGNYSVIVSNGGSSLTSDTAKLTVLVPPIIVSQPESLMVTNTQSASFSVVVAGSTPFSYQWFYNGVPLPGQTKTNLTIASVKTNDLGVYSVAVTGPGGTAASSGALLTFPEPTVLLQPEDQTVVAGSQVTFTVVAGGDAPLSYQWLLNGVAIPGATSATFTLSPAQPSDGGVYSVVVTNALGSASADFLLTVNPPPGPHLFVSAGNGQILEFSPSGARSVFALGGGGLGFDNSGNLFVAGMGGGVYKFAPNGAGSLFVTLFNGPSSVAVDTASNLYVGVSGNGYIFKYAPDGTQSVFGQEPAENGSFSEGRPWGLAFDAQGNLFATDEFYGRIFKGGSGFSPWAYVNGDPWGLAFDSHGNLFVADSYGGNIYKFSNSAGTLSPYYSVHASGLGQPSGVAVDAQDNLFVADFNTGTIYEYNATNGTRTVFATGLGGVTSLAFGTPSVPRVQFAATPTSGEAPLVVQFQCPNLDSLNNTITNWSWDFGDGTTGTGQNPSHTYLTGGDFLAHMVGTNDQGVAVFGSGPLLSITAPTVAFTANPSDGTVPLTVQFACPAVDSNSNALTGWAWDFGDGTTGTGQNPSHTYTNDGSFYPSLLATNSQGVTVAGSGPSINVALPEVQFSASPDEGTVALTVQFSCPATDNSGHALTDWSWDFGDGSTSTDQNPSHTYTDTGTYYPSLVAHNAAGYTVLGSGPEVTVSPPSVAFSATPTRGAAPLTVQFSSPAVDSGGNAITNWTWDFGDGSTSTDQNPVHTYTSTQEFQPQLTAVNDLGMDVVGSGPAISTVPGNNLVLNGGFETGDFSFWQTSGNFRYSYVSADDPSYVHSGSYGAQLGPYSPPGYLSQTVPTTPGTTYLLSFWLANTPDGQPPNEFLVSWNGTTLYDARDFGDLEWTNIQLTVAATGNSSTLQFGFYSDNTYLGLDDITLTPVSTASPQPVLTGISLADTDLVLSGTNGLAGRTYNILASPDVTLPLSQWAPVATNVLDADGAFSIRATNALSAHPVQQFYRLRLEP